MIQDIGYPGCINHPYRWHSVSVLRSTSHKEENSLLECRRLMNLITKAIDSQCRNIRDRKKSLEEIRKLFTIYVTLNSYARQAEMEKVRSQLDDKNTPVSPEFISVPHYEDELIRNK